MLKVKTVENSIYLLCKYKPAVLKIYLNNIIIKSILRLNDWYIKNLMYLQEYIASLNFI